MKKSPETLACLNSPTRNAYDSFEVLVLYLSPSNSALFSLGLGSEFGIGGKGGHDYVS
jgi:hypothetical protein